jgi:hypothetical protein
MGMVWFLSMVVNKIDIERVRLGKTKDHSPVGTNGNCPTTQQLALKRVQAEGWQFHVIDRRRRIQDRQDFSKLLNMLCIHAARVVVFEQGVSVLCDETNGSL